MYITIPKSISYNDLVQKVSLSPHSYKTIPITNQNTKKLKDLLTEAPKKGIEVGSSAYIQKSNRYFIRNIALQYTYLLPVLDNVECAVPILPRVFQDYKLQAGDILISKDANIGDAAFLDHHLPDYMISGGIVRLKFPNEIKHYVFSFMKSEYFKSQVEIMTARAAVIKHAKSLWLDAIIPFPNKNSEETIQFVGALTRALIRKEAEIRKKYKIIIDAIREEITHNQKEKQFVYSMASFNELKETGRLDASIYSKQLKHKLFLIDNYKEGCFSLEKMGYQPRRGPNLAVSVIGLNIYSDEERPNFYRLIEPVDISDYMTIERFRWLGNKTSIPNLRKGDILFGAEGNIGKVIILCDNLKNTITNYHGMSITCEDEHSLTENIFIGCFLSYLKEEGVFEKISIGGQGGSVGKNVLLKLNIPNFPTNCRSKIAKYYYNYRPYESNKMNADDFETEDISVTIESGLWQLNKQYRSIKQKLSDTLNGILIDDEVEIVYDFVDNAEQL